MSSKKKKVILKYLISKKALEHRVMVSCKYLQLDVNKDVMVVYWQNGNFTFCQVIS